MTKSIDQKIVSVSVVNGEPAQPEPADPGIQLVSLDPHDRPRIVDGRTYKIKPPVSDSAMYITINNVSLPDGSRRPIEIFINSKSTESFQWITGLTRLISALFRQRGDFLFMIEEMTQVFDPNGGYFLPGGGRVSSVMAHIGLIIEEHCRDLGLLGEPELSDVQKAMIADKTAEAKSKGIKGTLCAKCNETSVVILDGCQTCLNCGDSKCG